MPPLVSLLEEMGVVEGKDKNGEPVIGEQFLCRDPEERVFYKGRWYEGLYLHAGENEDDKQQFRKFNTEVDHWIAWRDAKGRRAFTLPSVCMFRRRGSDSARSAFDERVDGPAWLTSPRLRWWVDYACRDDYGMTLEQTSAWAGLFYFCSRVVAPENESQSLITWPEGNGRLVQHLFEKVKANIQLDRAAVELIPTNDGVDVDTLDRDGRTPRGFHASRVIFAAPQFMARYVVRPYRDNPPPHISEFHFGAWMVANLTLKDRPKASSARDFPLAWDNVLYESPSLGYVVATHQRGLDRGPTVLTYYYPLCDENPRARAHAVVGD